VDREAHAILKTLEWQTSVEDCIHLVVSRWDDWNGTPKQ
jgi:hypothetical protein